MSTSRLELARGVERHGLVFSYKSIHDSAKKVKISDRATTILIIRSVIMIGHAPLPCKQYCIIDISSLKGEGVRSYLRMAFGPQCIIGPGHQAGARVHDAGQFNVRPFNTPETFSKQSSLSMHLKL